jgi:GT2 family glycosyltransferase
MRTTTGLTGGGEQIAPTGGAGVHSTAGPAAQARVRVDGKFFARLGRRLRVGGVTYGPFRPGADREPFPPPDRVAQDFSLMAAAGIDAVRTYHLPPEWLLSLADEHGLALLVDVPWPKHLCFLDTPGAEAEARRLVRQAALRGRGHPCVLAYSVGNEIPAGVVRWYGRRRVERFVAELADVARQADPGGLVTYASYPPTEYLDLPFLDFATFNVYLHDPGAFRRYLLRLQNLVGDKPLVLGELGMDTLRHGQAGQARFLAGHLREAALLGLAGAFVFSWTDDWFTGGHPVHDWAFGITHHDRMPKTACVAVREVFGASPTQLLPEAPRVSVVVCTYNGGRTLAECLRSLLALDYPDYEVIVVDDGSTDDTAEILARFPQARAIRQDNQGLSAARNAGLRAATGQVIAYTDSDCYADPLWLTHLVHQLQQSDAAAVGGPNLTPPDGPLAACVAAAPGQPTHVLESDQVAEHIPGCNMAFRREALLAVRGFDPAYRRAGDDVDLCWRLQQAGYWITFAPGAFVWHHRRQGPRAYLRQQAGYGEAEALLRFKHPDRFNGRGDGKWRGAMYGASLRGLRLWGPIIYRGTFGTGLFGCLYQRGPAHWAMLPATLEWHAVAAAALLASLLYTPALFAAILMLTLSLAVSALQAVLARLDPAHGRLGYRLLVMALCHAQPLVRSWSRYRTRFFAYRAPMATPDAAGLRRWRLPLTGRRTAAYWSEDGLGRLQLLGCVVCYLNENRWGRTIDSGWSDWDLELYCHPWTVVQLATAEEDHGGNRRLVRVRFRLRASGYTKALVGLALLAGVAGPSFPPAAAAAAVLLAACLGLWWRGTYRASQAVAVVDRSAKDLGMVECSHATPLRGESAPLGHPADSAGQMNGSACTARWAGPGAVDGRTPGAAMLGGVPRPDGGRR